MRLAHNQFFTFIRRLLCKLKKKCPSPTCKNEDPECEQRRISFANDSPVSADNAWQNSIFKINRN